MSKVFRYIKEEKKRQKNTIELIASENFVSKNVMKAVGSCLTNKYAEGYPKTRSTGNKGRYYGGCENIDNIEEYCCNKWKEVFKTNYHCNVQPHSGTNANLAAYMAVLKPGDTVLAMSLNNGGHLSHGSPVNISGKLFNFKFYDIDSSGYIDYNDLEEKILKYKPKLIVAGASAYPRAIDFAKIKEIIDKCRTSIAYDNILNQNFDYNGDCITPDIVDYNPLFMVDMAHIAGLVAAGIHLSPFGVADIITTTTHKTLRGPRGGIIFCKPYLAKKIDSAVFPCCQGGPLEHIIAGKAVAAEEALELDYIKYMERVVLNSKAMAEYFKKMGYDIVTGGTDNHLFLIDFSRTHPHLTGRMIQEELDRNGITVNKNCVPNEKRTPKETSGIRIGTAAMTTKGYREKDFINVARKIDKIIKTM